MPQLKIKN